MNRAVLVIITSKECPACSQLVKERNVIERGYKSRSDVNLVFIHSNKKNMDFDVRKVNPKLRKLAGWTPFIILITAKSFKDPSNENELKYETMNFKDVGKPHIDQYAHSKIGIDQFVNYQLKKNPLFATNIPRELHSKRISKIHSTPVKSKIKPKNKYSLDHQPDFNDNNTSKYTRDEV